MGKPIHFSELCREAPDFPDPADTGLLPEYPEPRPSLVPARPHALPDLSDKAMLDADPGLKQTTFIVTLILLHGSVIIGNLCNVIAMKFYPLTKEKMEEIQAEIAAIKAKATEK